MNDRVDAVRLEAPALRSDRRRSNLRDSRITLSHGSGGQAMRDLIDDVFAATFANAALAPLEDQARVFLPGLAGRLAFTTDSYVVDPLFFPGGDIGSLAVNGTVNNLAVGGARPLYLSCAVILEEGLDVALLRRIVRSMADAAARAGVAIVTGDTKVVPRGVADKMFINTAGVGVIAAGVDLCATRAQPGDVVVVNGPLGDHGATILAARERLAPGEPIVSDCQPLHGLVHAMLDACGDIRCIRDATRGGVATVANEIAQASGTCVRLVRDKLPFRESVAAIGDLLRLDPLYLASEGKLVAVVPAGAADCVLAAMRAHPAGLHSVVVGEIVDGPARTVTVVTRSEGERVIDMVIGQPMPRIC